MHFSMKSLKNSNLSLIEGMRSPFSSRIESDCEFEHLSYFIELLTWALLLSTRSDRVFCSPYVLFAHLREFSLFMSKCLFY